MPALLNARMAFVIDVFEFRSVRIQWWRNAKGERTDAFAFAYYRRESVQAAAVTETSNSKPSAS
jgi:hypothetical protein